MINLPPYQKICLEILLLQYQAYQLAEKNSTDRPTSAKLDANTISQTMLFPDPVTWMLYKYYAYQNTDQAINTLGDLIHHCDHGICQKRWQFVSTHYPLLLDPHIFNHNRLLEQIATDTYMLADITNDQILTRWKLQEYQGVQQIKKWQNYAAIRA